MSGKAQAPAQPAEAKPQAQLVERLFTDSCEGVVPQDDLNRLLKENILATNKTHDDTPMIGLEQLDCRWTGTSRIPDKATGVFSRELIVGMDRSYPTADFPGPEHALQQTERNFTSGRFSDRAGFVPFQVPGTDRAVRYSRGGPKTITLGMQVTNVFVEVSYDDPELSQEQVDQEALNLAAKVIGQLKK